MSDFTELSRKAYEAISGDDVDAFVALADPNVEFNSIVEGKTYHGHDGVREWWSNVINNLGGFGLELAQVEDFEDHGYVKMTVTPAESSNLEMPTEIYQAMRLEDGKAVWWGVFGTEKEAREGLGV